MRHYSEHWIVLSPMLFLRQSVLHVMLFIHSIFFSSNEWDGNKMNERVNERMSVCEWCAPKFKTKEFHTNPVRSTQAHDTQRKWVCLCFILYLYRIYMAISSIHTWNFNICGRYTNSFFVRKNEKGNNKDNFILFFYFHFSHNFYVLSMKTNNHFYCKL